MREEYTALKSLLKQGCLGLCKELGIKTDTQTLYDVAGILITKHESIRKGTDLGLTQYCLLGERLNEDSSPVSLPVEIELVSIFHMASDEEAKREAMTIWGRKVGCQMVFRRVD